MSAYPIQVKSIAYMTSYSTTDGTPYCRKTEQIDEIVCGV